MGFFAIARDDGGASFQVKECHINLWSLPRLLGLSLFLCDVGVLLEADANSDLASLQIALPFGTASDGASDLREKLHDEKVVQLIFTKRAQIDTRNPVTVITLDDTAGVSGAASAPTTLNVYPVSLEYGERRDQANFSLWKITFPNPVPQGQKAYIRVRFKVKSRGRMWSWKRASTSFTHNGALIDLRIADMREALLVRDRDSLRNLIVEIDRLFVFVIASSRFRLQVVDPATYYIRLIEGRAWEGYLDRATGILGKPRMVIYEWRSKNGDKVDLRNPFRIFLQLGQEYGLWSLGNHMRTAILTAVLLLVMLFGSGSLHVQSSSAAAAAGKHLPDFLTTVGQHLGITLGGITVVGLITLVLGLSGRYIKPAQDLYNLVKTGFSKLDQHTYRPRG